jgi:putative (di)nucleoside polyphosphate hydrolase
MQGAAKRISCGVVVTDGERLLLGHATGSPRWDIPKGGQDPGEKAIGCAIRELREETGLVVPAEDLRPLGTHEYMRGKGLVLFAWQPAVLPDPAALHCTSMATLRNGRTVPELDRFGLFDWEAGLALVGRNLARVLAEVRGDLPRD